MFRKPAGYFAATVVVLMVAACSAPSPSPEPSATVRPTSTLPGLAATLTAEPSNPTLPPPTNTPTSAPTTAPAAASSAWDVPVSLHPLKANLSGSFAGDIDSQTWTPSAYKGPDYALPIDVATTANPEVTQGLTPDQLALLGQNGFVVMHTQEPDYAQLRASVEIKGQAQYITVDEALHAFHMTFDGTLKSLEKNVLRQRMLGIVTSTNAQVLSTLDSSKGTSIEGDTLLAAAYLGVAQKLLDPSAQLDPRIEPQVTAQVAQIMAGGGQAPSVLIPGFTDDYGSYKPVSHYAGDPDLENYFRGMTWLGRVHFKLTDPEDPNFRPSRAPLIITQALRRAHGVTGENSAGDDWAHVHEALTFLVGPSDDSGPLEYAALMDEIYGSSPKPSDLADDARWQTFLSKAQTGLPSPRINSTFLNWISQLPADKGWRFMGQRFTLDGYIFQQVMFDAVKPADNGDRRSLPTGPDVMAALGSPVAVQAVDEEGMSNYPNYRDQIAAMQQHVTAQPASQWQARFYDSWLYGFISLISPKDASFPAFARTDAWAFREMNTALGSWAELKHDTVLYAKMPEGLGGGGCYDTSPVPVYIEPQPEVFYRFEYAAQSLANGLHNRGLDQDSGAVDPANPPVGYMLDAMGRMSMTLKLYGDVAAAELSGTPITNDQRDALGYSCLICYDDPNPKPVPVVAAVAGSGLETILEVGTGSVDRMYAVVPIDGKLYVAQGGVYSYYEFQQPRSNRLTDDQWRARLASPDAPPLPVWTAHYLRPGGQVITPLVFKVGGVYQLTKEGLNLNVRETPSATGKVLATLKDGYGYLTIEDGPVDADGHRWWKVKADCMEQAEGWVQENPDWFTWSY